jgi:hypothetical protein
MTEITPTTAVLELTKLSRALDESGFRLHEAELTAVTKRHEFTVAQAKAFNLDTAAERVAAELAEAEVRIIKSDIRILENRMDVGRSVVGVLRAEAQAVR